MARRELDVEVVDEGAWGAAPGVWLPALVLRSTRDVWAELGAEPQAGPDGVVYYHSLRALESTGFWPASPAFATREAARAAVEAKAAVVWGREPSKIV